MASQTEQTITHNFTITSWKGVLIAKMLRKDLEAEFIRLATADKMRTTPVYVAGTVEPGLPKPPLDPHTARSLRELQSVCAAIESGAAGVLEFADSIEAEPKITRKMLVVVGYATRKP